MIVLPDHTVGKMKATRLNHPTNEDLMPDAVYISDAFTDPTHDSGDASLQLRTLQRSDGRSEAWG